MKEIYKDIYLVKVPLNGNPLKELNCYMIRGKNRNLVIDVGFNQTEGIQKILEGYRTLNFRPKETDIFITHAHEDHIGALETLQQGGYYRHAYIGEREAAFYNDLRVKGLKESTLQMAKWEGFSEEEGEQAFYSHPGAKLIGNLQLMKFWTLKEGDEIDLGNYKFQVYIFPGHTMGLAALYEKRHKLLFAGDHILGKITPNIAFWQGDFDAVGEYMQSLWRASCLEVAHLFSSHRDCPSDMEARIRELLKHHKIRLREALNIVEEEKEGQTVCQIAGKMRWDFAGGNFAAFPITQKWFAAGEAFAHLEYLYKRKMIRRTEENGAYLYLRNL